MSHYILVHGAWHGGWCWHRVVASLERASNRAIAPDLASLGRDRTPPGDVSLALWTDQIAALVAAQPEPVVLVGHSRGGIVLSDVAGRMPERLRALVYVTAFLLEDGRSVRDEAVREAFYGQCRDEDVELAKSLLVPEPLAPLATPVRVSAGRFGSVPRIYVECTADRAITLAGV